MRSDSVRTLVTSFGLFGECAESNLRLTLGDRFVLQARRFSGLTLPYEVNVDYPLIKYKAVMDWFPKSTRVRVGLDCPEGDGKTFDFGSVELDSTSERDNGLVGCSGHNFLWNQSTMAYGVLAASIRR